MATTTYSTKAQDETLPDDRAYQARQAIKTGLLALGILAAATFGYLWSTSGTQDAPAEHQKPIKALDDLKEQEEGVLTVR